MLGLKGFTRYPGKQQTEKRFVVTPKEAAIIASFSEDGEALVPEIAVSARLTPSEVLDVVHRLKEKELVEIHSGKEQPTSVELTASGGEAQRELKRNRGNVIITS